MKKIYVFGIFTGKSSYGYIQDAEPCGDVVGYAVYKQDWTDIDGRVKLVILANHFSSGKNWCKHDMGITSDWKHDIYDAAYPDGYELVWLDCFNTMDDAYNAVVSIT